jgi:3-oxoacyl-[acyl-carrier-protein] synthase II
MKAYIRSAASISPQKTFNHPGGLDEPVEYHTNRLACIEPDYHGIIDPRAIRRMSRIIKISVAAALTALKDAGISKPDAIITGTAYGCLEDTGAFLTGIIEQHEDPYSPMAFVQATHNTIGAQIALLLGSAGYNNTFVSGGASFELALQDSTMSLAEGLDCILVGGMDEITDASYAILRRTGLYKLAPGSNFEILQSKTKGTIGGQGAAFFVLANTPSAADLACIDGVATYHKPEGTNELATWIKSFLSAQSVDLGDIDLIIAGKNGDLKNDAIYADLQLLLFDGIPMGTYKNLCGEYPTSTAFALWVAANIAKTNAIPAALNVTGEAKTKTKKILIYNHYQNIYHSLILLSAC